MAGFHAQLEHSWASSGSMLCIGLDPDPARLPTPFDGASEDHTNPNAKGEEVHQGKWHDGQLSEDWALEMFDWDPYHQNSDVLRQLFHDQPRGYEEGATPDLLLLFGI